ncbi:Eclosion hormone [Papilio machaon]|uniref:Eclosion hormone n=1 Tax=Papilio machaon TaxID=76193 RepID=A0A0N1IPR8_PAPMA|nr:Eclosion hormone [Papilio machaon]
MEPVKAEPANFGFDSMNICIENCAQCKSMLGQWFQGPLCAQSCIQQRGQFIPDCEDFASIAPFLTKI